MSSTAARRASYQLDVARRSSTKAPMAASAQTSSTTDDDDAQQRLSPQVLKLTSLRGGEDDNNNQEEESTEDSAPRPVHENAVEPIRKQQHQLRNQAALNSEPLTTVRLRQENAALQLKLQQFGNQHETEIHELKSTLALARSEHQLAEQKMKAQIRDLEKRQFEAAANVHKYQAHLVTLQELLRELQSQAKEKIDTLHLKTPSKQQIQARAARIPNQGRGNGSPLPLGSHDCFPGAEPVASRQDGVRACYSRVSPMEISVPASMYSSPSIEINKESEKLATSRVIPFSTRYGAGASHVVDEASDTNRPIPSLYATSLPLPRSVTKDQQLRYETPSKNMPSQGYSFCADVPVANLAPPAKPVAYQSTKVMPAWRLAHDHQYDQCSIPETTPVPHTDTVTRKAFTAITIL